eukprot:CAMPEP_0113944694 /NCGR_PEP_ID=MMETSP1339-20121228/35793_1 /TAXON_ID=94617 /ORGANISM="Fibrocapsa japonica" /LENGTH=233 /DNA_ID=CAMNT_0000949981 /DNA_START=189 /DNA_END=890 /DNA_ORIENTATION=+ /assembly_acc=CAM_ASM_000762
MSRRTRGIFGSSSSSSSSAKRKGSSKAQPRVDMAAVRELFDRYEDHDENPGSITMEGISQLAEELGMDAAADVRVLVMCWKIGAQTPGALLREEWEQGLERLAVDSIEALRSLLPSFDPGFLDRAEYRDFFRFTFQFSREGTHKTIEKEIVEALLPMVLDSNRSPHLEGFLTFLAQCPPNTRITMDQWNSFLEFSYQVGPDLNEYDENGAWPTLLDEYVEFIRSPQESKENGR